MQLPVWNQRQECNPGEHAILGLLKIPGCGEPVEADCHMDLSCDITSNTIRAARFLPSEFMIGLSFIVSQGMETVGLALPPELNQAPEGLLLHFCWSH